MTNSPKAIISVLEALSAEPGISQADSGGRLKIDLPLVTATGPLGEMSVLPPQVDLSEFKLGPRYSGESNGASKLDWSVFAEAASEKEGERSNRKGSQ